MWSTIPYATRLFVANLRTPSLRYIAELADRWTPRKIQPSIPNKKNTSRYSLSRVGGVSFITTITYRRHVFITVSPFVYDLSGGRPVIRFAFVFTSSFALAVFDQLYVSFAGHRVNKLQRYCFSVRLIHLLWRRLFCRRISNATIDVRDIVVRWRIVQRWSRQRFVHFFVLICWN